MNTRPLVYDTDMFLGSGDNKVPFATCNSIVILLLVNVAAQLSFSGRQKLEKTTPSLYWESVMFMMDWLLRTLTGSTFASKPSIVGQ